MLFPRMTLLLCLLDGHKPMDRSISWNGVFHIGSCRYCGRLVRKSRRGFWKRINTTTDP